ncbi:hypothetical protein Aph01nite_43550 [Acrocarpospora phusangensis]|uniref:Uncharacterized protein n=1 Tax=Acrocarpospora phusangensis TaxID=1070424 RepID=A0A919US22_9ACTN|nr:hypothetical protein [Acrocarpospora phusangensis]GIH26045.1 hypothetical protein Aph01nite_43550 [Acrocarpospora phusangensis]
MRDDDVVTVVQDRFRLHAAAVEPQPITSVMRLQVLALPDGRFVLVVTGGALSTDDHDTLAGLAETLGAAELVVLTQPIEVG